MFHLLPYLEQENIFKSSLLPGPNYANLSGENPGGPYYSVENGLGTASSVGANVIQTFMCPSDGTNPTGGAFVNPIAASLNASDAGDVFAPTNYACNAQVFGLPWTFGGNPVPLSLTQITDGTSNTILFGERLQYCDGTNVPGDGQQRGTFWDWSEPASQSGNSQYPFFSNYWETGLFQLLPSVGNCDYQLLNSPHANGMNACMGDGSVRTFHSSMSLATFQAICTPSGGETLPNENDW